MSKPIQREGEWTAFRIPNFEFDGARKGVSGLGVGCPRMGLVAGREAAIGSWISGLLPLSPGISILGVGASGHAATMTKETEKLKINPRRWVDGKSEIRNSKFEIRNRPIACGA
jgi:hypothetical protein